MIKKIAQFVRKYTIAFCLGLIGMIMVVVSAFGLHGAVRAKAEESSAKPDVLTMLNGKEHPYVFVNEEYLDELIALQDNPYYSDAFTWVFNKAKEELPAQPEEGYLSDPISRQLEAKAFMYMLGELSEKEALEAVEYTIEYTRNPKTSKIDSIAMYKDFGNNAIQTGSLVYDWCYDLMSNSQRKELAANIRNQMYASVQPCTPNNVETWSEVGGKAVGQPLIYNSIASLALYDIYPEIYNAIMPKVLGSMSEAVKIYGEAGALSDGSISYTRDYYAYVVAMLLDRLGYNYEVYYGNQLNIGYKMLYSRIPYGALVTQGDDFDHRDYIIGRYLNKNETKMDMSILSTMYSDPYMKFQYFKENNNMSTLFSLLLYSNTVDPKLPDDLPLAYKTGNPRSEVLARTSWQDGLDSPAVVAYMNMHNRRSGDHDHAQVGDFQLYYKGPLTRPAGIYTGGNWGGTHWRNYLVRSISANCITVYDENEIFTYYDGNRKAEANDGGQKMAVLKSGLAENMADDNLVAVTEASFIGPNENTPAFSYMKGDITKAYSSNKMASYKRAMVFMDTFNEEYPGVMVVFDRVVSTNKDFPKKWLLQAVTEPQITGNQITIVNTEDGCNGKLVNNTLYPQNVTIDKVGGVGEYISDGQEWAQAYDASMSKSYVGGWRCEVAPTTAATEDIFLNAMYVTDADGNAADLPMISEETDKFMGVTTLDRMVMFSKSGEKVSTAFNITVRDNGYEDVICLITDVATGKWNVSGNGTSLIAEATEKDGCLVFTVKSGEYTITPADAGAEATEFIWDEAEKDAIGDFAVKVGSTYTYVESPNRLINGKPYIAIADFMEKYCGATTKMDGKTLEITLKDGRVVTLNAGSKDYMINNMQETLDDKPFLSVDGTFYLNCSGISRKLGFNASYVDAAKVLYVTIFNEGALEGVDQSKVLWPISITASTDDGNVPDNTIDRDLGTRWSSVVADGEWICFDLGEEMNLSSVQIAFFNGAKRNWMFDIQVSNDGVTFTDVLTDQRSCGTTVNPETFPLPAGTKARYVRYIGHGVDDSATGNFVGYYSSITEFIINE